MENQLPQQVKDALKTAENEISQLDGKMKAQATKILGEIHSNSAKFLDKPIKLWIVIIIAIAIFFLSRMV